ncbi:MAG: response regulator [Bacteroidota bacterium]
MTARKERILVVDDERDLREVIKDILTDAGYEVFLAENGIHGLGLAKSVLPDLILCDIQMPSMNGYDLLNAVKIDPDMGKIPFVFMTGVNVGPYDLRKGMDLGADDYLTKPFSTDELISAVQTRLQKKQLWQKFFDMNIEKAQTGFIVLLSNELHILVMDILEHAQALRAGMDLSPETVRTAAKQITLSGKRLSRLHENILLYAMLQLWVNDEEKIRSLRQERTASYRTVMHAVINENMRAHDRKGSITIEGNDAALQIAPADFGKIIDEVIDNACKFSEPGSAVVITAAEMEHSILISIRDEGRGMTEQEINTIDSLMKAGVSHYRKEELGLGLTIARTLAELHRGALSIESKENEGTTVSILIPKATDR